MISFRLEDYHEELKATVAEFARDVVAPVIGGYYERGEFPYEIVARMAKLGLFGLPFPEEYGGMGGDLFAFCLALEELARVDSSVAITLEAAVALGAMPIYRFGTEEQRRRWLPDLCAGERLAAFGLTEPGGGSDIPGGMRTTAALVNGDGEAGGEWVIDGSKSFITNAGTAITSLVTVLAITGGRAGGRDGAGERPEISAIIVPAGTPGFTVGREYSKVGWCASDTRELAFASCRVPADHLLGERGRGYAQFLRDTRRGAGGDRGPGDRPGGGLRVGMPAAGGAARGIRPPARPLPGDPVHAGGHGGEGPLRPAGLVRRRGQAGRRGAGEEAGGHRQADRLERGHGQRA